MSSNRQTKFHFDWISAKDVELLCGNRELDETPGSKDLLSSRVAKYESINNSELEYELLNVVRLKAELKVRGLSANGKKEELMERLKNGVFNCYEEEHLNGICEETSDSLQMLKKQIKTFNKYLKTQYIDINNNNNNKFNLFNNNNDLDSSDESSDESEDDDIDIEMRINKKKSKNKYKQIKYLNKTINESNKNKNKIKTKIKQQREYLGLNEWKLLNTAIKDKNIEIKELRYYCAEYGDILENNSDSNDNDDGGGSGGSSGGSDGSKDDDLPDSLVYVVYDDNDKLILKQNEAMIVGVFAKESKAEYVSDLNKRYAIAEMVLDKPDIKKKSESDDN